MNPIIIIIIVLALLLIFLIALLKLTRVPGAVYKNKVKYSDHAKAPVKPFFSNKYWLTGKPDYILDTKDGLIPLDIKNTAKPKEPYFGHVMQVVSYCLLMEEENAIPPKYGILRYNDGQFYISYTPERKAHLLKTMDKMKQHMRSNTCPEPDPKSRCKLHTTVSL